MKKDHVFDLDFTNEELTALFNAPKVYFVQHTVRNSQGHFIPCIAVQGQTGYYKTDWSWDCDFETAQFLCAEKNAQIDITPKDAAHIVLSSMRL